ncbi:hypothetical protein BTHE68_34540 [Burkholderia sp. THE68]|nr:hypothetical protein BTHE68_34540 [Burkholderia sp. THE68]
MLRHGLARHAKAVAQIAERLAILRVQPVEQLPAARVRKRAKNRIVIHERIMQLFGCMSSGFERRNWQRTNDNAPEAFRFRGVA